MTKVKKTEAPQPDLIVKRTVKGGAWGLWSNVQGKWMPTSKIVVSNVKGKLSASVVMTVGVNDHA